MVSRTIFWDRDKTLIADPGYIDNPDQVELLPGSADALSRLADVGYQNIIVTNQSGIARGLLDEATLERIHDRLQQLMADYGATVDAIYYCPYLDGPEAVVEQYRQDSDLRKPKPGMLVKASLERNIDLSASWMIGDSLHDVQAGRAAGCRTILICNDAATADTGKSGEIDFVAKSLDEAVEIVQKHTREYQSDRKQVDATGSRAILQEILSFLRMVDRRSQAEDFSIARLAGAVVQILALAVLITALFGMIRGDQQAWGAQMVRLLFGIFLQLLALTFFVLSTKK
ncbi:MAG: D-glycero-alpha-D-manno-heptose-1,7-bisphosphate 7-phosphatase [Planctomycetota bacterium]|jgi:D,D-heptose 1,7-bisphosphate phosphatase